MIRKITIGLLAIITMMLLSLFFTGCKSRKVTLKVQDSTGKTEKQNESHLKETQADKSTTKTVTTTVKTDSTETTTVITPADGEVISVKPDGTFTGKSKKVEITTKKRGKETTDQNQQVQKDVKTERVADTKSKEKQESKTHVKTKDVKSTPDYSWIIYAGIAILIIFIGVIWYVKRKA